MTAPSKGRKAHTARPVIRGSGGLAVLYILDAVGAVVQNAVLGRFLFLHDYGILAALLSAGMFVFVIADFGTGMAVARLMAQAVDRERASRFNSLWSTRVIMTLLGSLSAIGLAWVLAPQSAWLSSLVIGSEVFRSLANFLTSAARGLTEVRPVLVISATDRFGTVLGSIFAVAIGWGLGGVVSAYLFARTLSCLCGVFWARSAGLKLRVVLSPTRLWQEVVKLVPLATLLASDRIVFYSMPLLLATFSSADQTGLYQAALKVGLLPISLCSALLSAYFPEMVRDASRERGQRNVVGVYFFLCVIGTPLVALCFAVPGPLLQLMFGPAFASGASTLRLLGGFVLLNTVYQVSVHLLPAYGRESVLLKTTSVGTAVCVGTAAMTAGKYGALGGAWAVTLYAVVTLIPHLITLRRIVRVDHAERRLLAEGWIALALGMMCAIPLAFARAQLPVLIGMWTFCAAIGVLAVLTRNRQVLIPLIVRQAPGVGSTTEAARHLPKVGETP